MKSNGLMNQFKAHNSYKNFNLTWHSCSWQIVQQHEVHFVEDHISASTHQNK